MTDQSVCNTRLAPLPLLLLRLCLCLLLHVLLRLCVPVTLLLTCRPSSLLVGTFLWAHLGGWMM